MNLFPGPDGSHKAQFERAQELPAWKQWRAQLCVDLPTFRTRDVVELKTVRDPLTPEGLRIAELAAHQLFPPDRPREVVVADRWNRFVGQVFAVLLDGEWVNAPAYIDDGGDDRLLPVVRLPTWGGRYILPLLDAVLAKPEGSARHGSVLCDALAKEYNAFSAWVAAGWPAEHGRR